MQHAAQLGVRVRGVYISEPDLLGYYSHKDRVITFDMRLTPAERRSVIAHELGHAFHGHDCDSERNERQADTYAAELLINPDDFAELERFNPDPYFLAEEFDVTAEIIEAYKTHCLTRLRGVTYARSKMGSGQWAYRSANG